MQKKRRFIDAKISGESFRDKVTMPKKRPFQDDKVSREQIKRIILALKHLGLKTLLMLVKDTQARPGELLGLQVSDFNLSHEPAYLNIPAERAKNDMPRELFFTQETKEILLNLIGKEEKKPSDFVFLPKDVDQYNERELQKKIGFIESNLGKILRELLSQPQFADLNGVVPQRGMYKRYKIHIYSFKKFAFTVMADELGEIAARAIKGDREYVLTYYRKSREERAADYKYVIPKLSVFGTDDKYKVREAIGEKIKTMKEDELAKLQKFLETANA